MDRGVRFGRKPKLSQFQIAEALARRGGYWEELWRKPQHDLAALAPRLFLGYTSQRCNLY
jgi:hypothetical protein